MISIVIPVYNEEDSLLPLHEELRTVLASMDEAYELIFVNDGSSDQSAPRLRRLQQDYPSVKVISFIRNFGKSAAYSAAFQAAKGDIIATLDADLQDDPAELPHLIETLNEGHDLVIGWKRDRFANEPHKAVPSKFFNGLVSMIFALPLRDTNSGYRVMRREVAKSLSLRGDLYRFIPQLAHMEGFRIGERAVNHRQRQHGHSKFGPTRFWTGLLDVLTVRFITRFKDKPLHFLGTVGLFPIVLGCGLEAYVLIMKLAFDSPFRTHMAALVIGVLLLLTGVQFVATGLIGEMLSAQHSKPDFVVDDMEDTATVQPQLPHQDSALEHGESSTDIAHQSQAPAKQVET